MKSVRYIYRLTCASWLPLLRTSGFEIGWDLGFEPIFTVVIVMGALFISPLGYYINMLLGLEIDNYFCSWEISSVGFSLVALYE